MRALFNPTNKDFSVTYDIHETGIPETYTVKSMETEYFDEPIFSHVKKHLLDFLINERGTNPTFLEDVKECEKEIDTDLWINK